MVGNPKGFTEAAESSGERQSNRQGVYGGRHLRCRGRRVCVSVARSAEPAPLARPPRVQVSEAVWTLKDWLTRRWSEGSRCWMLESWLMPLVQAAARCAGSGRAKRTEL